MNSEHRDIKKSQEDEERKDNIQVWEDIVRIKDLVISLIVCSVTTLGAYFLAPKQPPKPLFFGLSGAIIGFVICTILIKPKRIFIETDQEE